jgi:pentalenene oxygenase
VRSLPARGDLAEIRIATQKVIVVCDPSLTRHILVTDRIYDKGGWIFDWLREVAGNGIGGRPHTDHRRQRRAVQPAFAPSRIPVYAAAITAQSRHVTDSWRDGQLIDVYSETHHLTTLIAITTLFAGCAIGGQLAEAEKDVRTVMASTGDNHTSHAQPPAHARQTPLRPGPCPPARHHQEDHRRTSRHRHRPQRSAVNDHHSAISQHTVLSDAEIEDQVMTFFLASVETSANTLAWTLYLLARHPEIQHRLHKELDTVLAGRPVTADDLSSLPLIGQIITESLRLYPPGWFLTRTTTTEAWLAGKLIPAGSVLAYSPYLIHHRPDVIPPPRDIRSGPVERPHISPGSTQPNPSLSAGPRRCIGDLFSMTETCIALATICARFTAQSVSDHHVRPALSAQLHPRKFRLRAVARETAP